MFSMRKVILSSVIIIIVFSILFLVIGTVRKIQNHKLIEEKIAKLPSFSFTTLSNGSFNSSEIREGPALVVHFHPECEHCQYEISEILKSNIPDSFAIVILVSSAQPDSIIGFLKRVNYSVYPSVIPLMDTSYSFEGIFGSGIVPSSYIYNKKLNLIKVLHGEVKTETILKYLKESE
jgi:hypothetical protein